MIIFHLRPCLLKKNWEISEIFEFGYIFGFIAQINQNILRAHKNALQILNQLIKTFQISYQRPAYALFHPGPPPPPGPDPAKFHYWGAPWLALKSTITILDRTQLEDIISFIFSSFVYTPLYRLKMFFFSSKAQLVFVQKRMQQLITCFL